MAAEAVQAVRKYNWPLVALLVVSVMRKLSECVTRPMNRALSRPTKWCMRITIYHGTRVFLHAVVLGRMLVSINLFIFICI